MEQVSGTDALSRFDKTSQAVIKFETETDALFASLMFGEELQTTPLIPLSTVDTFLKLLKTPNFKLDQLSFAEGLDVVLQIAETRRRAAVKRSDTTRWPGVVSHMVVDFVAEELAQSSQNYDLRLPPR